ncbi:hypothetical protein ACOSQ3_007152 [Xanthoceras sorbifolium]
MSWLINSMMPNISENFLLYETAAEVWKAVKETYCHKDNTPELTYWQQLDAFEKHKWSSPVDSQQYKTIIETKRVYKFCLGLTSNLDAVRGRIFSTKPLPSLREAFSEVRREKSRRTLMLGTETKEMVGEASALATRNHQEPRGGGRPWCDHCRKPGHLKEKSNLSSTTGTEPFSKDQLDALHKILSQTQMSASPVVIGTGFIAQKGFDYGEDDWQC